VYAGGRMAARRRDRQERYDFIFRLTVVRRHLNRSREELASFVMVVRASYGGELEDRVRETVARYLTLENIDPTWAGCLVYIADGVRRTDEPFFGMPVGEIFGNFDPYETGIPLSRIGTRGHWTNRAIYRIPTRNRRRDRVTRNELLEQQPLRETEPESTEWMLPEGFTESLATQRPASFSAAVAPMLVQEALADDPLPGPRQAASSTNAASQRERDARWREQLRQALSDHTRASAPARSRQPATVALRPNTTQAMEAGALQAFFDSVVRHRSEPKVRDPRSVKAPKKVKSPPPAPRTQWDRLLEDDD
jgi:hypothetical protein